MSDKPSGWQLSLYQRGSWLPDRSYSKRGAAKRAGKATVREIASITSYRVEREREAE